MAIEVVTFVTHYDVLMKARADDRPEYRAAVNAVYSKAVGYGWGRIDAPGVKWPTHGMDALDFATAYAIHWTSGKVIHALREAYNTWYETGVIA